MEILIFIFTQSISYLVGILSGLSTNYIERKIKNHSNATKSGFEFKLKSKYLEIKFKKFKN